MRPVTSAMAEARTAASVASSSGVARSALMTQTRTGGVEVVGAVFGAFRGREGAEADRGSAGRHVASAIESACDERLR